MSAIVVENRACHSVPGWHDEFLTYILPAVETVARNRFRNLPAVEREEGQAEAVATAMLLFVRLVRRGKNPIVFAGRLAQVAVLRVLAGRLVSTPDNNRDVLSRFARQLRGIQVESLDARQHAPSGVWQEIVIEDRRSTPAETAACRIDVGAWLAGMTSRRRAIAESLAAGYRTEEVAEKFNLSSGRVSQLRREFEASWRAFQQQADELQAVAARI